MTALHPGQILDELRDLWASLGQAAEQGESHGVVRASAMTLIVFAEETENQVAAGELLAGLMHEHPHRAIVVRVRRGSPPMLEHRVLAQCWMPLGHREQICCEQIEITAAEASLADLAPVLLAIRAPDLPVVVWFRSASLFEVPALSAATLGADKVIVDSGGAADPLALLMRLAEVNATIPIADLAWTRLTRWRQIVAQVFENAAYRERLDRVRELRVSHGGRGHVSPEACYLAGWVRDALGRDVVVKFQAADKPAIEFLGRGIEPVHITSCAPAEDSAAMGEELGISGRDLVYDRAVRHAARLASRERR